MPDAVTVTQEQLDAMITAGVDRAMHRHAVELAAVRKNRDEILAEKKKLEGKAPLGPASQDFDAWMAKIDRSLSGKDPATGEPAGAHAYTLTREEARDPQKYRAAKEAAAKVGCDPVILDDRASLYWSAKRDGDGQGAGKVLRTEGAIYAHNDVCRDMQHYRRLRTEAEQTGKALRVFQDRVGLAQAAGADADALAAFDALGRA